LREAIKSHPVVLFMKGTPQAPQCGFSMRTSEALRACGAEFAYIDVIADPEVRQTLPGISEWPTFPQVFIGGELVGGCDIVIDLHQSGELQTLIDAAVAEQPEPEAEAE